MDELIQYVVVTARGGVYDCSFGTNLYAARAVAEDVTRSNTDGEVLRVARLVELTTEEEADIEAL